MEIDGKEYSQWLYDEIKAGKHTPLSNSTVIFYFKECAKNKDMGTAQFYVSAAYLVEELTTADEREEELLNKLEVYESPWIPIDYGQADSGKGCFDGKQHLVLINNKALCMARWDGTDWVLHIVVARPDGKVSTQMIHCSPSDVAHYRPIPANWIGGV